MIKLNLLPPTEKKYYQIETIRRFVVFLSIGLFVILLLFIGLLIFNYLFISFQLEPTMRQLEIEKATEKARKVEEFEKQIKETNRKITLLTNIKKEAAPISPVLDKLTASSAGKNSYLKTFSIDRRTNAIKIEGFSSTRDQVIKIQDNLKNDSSFSDINAPYSNFLKQTNIDFTFDFKLKP